MGHESNMQNNLEALLALIEVVRALRKAGVVFSDAEEELLKLFGSELLRFEKLSADFNAALDSGNYVRAGAIAPALANQTEIVTQLNRRVASKIQPIVDAITKKEN